MKPTEWKGKYKQAKDLIYELSIFCPYPLSDNYHTYCDKCDLYKDCLIVDAMVTIMDLKHKLIDK